MQPASFGGPHCIALLHAGGGDPFGRSSSLVPDSDTYLAFALDPGFEATEQERSPGIPLGPVVTGSASKSGPNECQSPVSSASARVISPTGNVAVDRTIRIRQILVRMRQEARSLPGAAAGGGGGIAAAPAGSKLQAPMLLSPSASSSRHSRSAWVPWLLPLEDVPPRNGIIARRRRAQGGADTERQPLEAEGAQVLPSVEGPLATTEQGQQQQQGQMCDEDDRDRALAASVPAEEGITFSKGRKKKGVPSGGTGEKLAALAGIMGSSIEAAGAAATKQPNLISRKGGALSANMDKLEVALGLPRFVLWACLRVP